MHLLETLKRWNPTNKIWRAILKNGTIYQWVFFFFFLILNFKFSPILWCSQTGDRSSTRWINQIWLQVREESRNFLWIRLYFGDLPRTYCPKTNPSKSGDFGTSLSCKSPFAWVIQDFNNQNFFSNSFVVSLQKQK